MFYIFIFLFYLPFLFVVIIALDRLGVRWKGKVIFSIFIICIPFWDVFVLKAIFLYYSVLNTPLQNIEEVVENPDSVYWDDQVWPGFDSSSRYAPN